MLFDIVILPPAKIRNLVSRAIIKAVGDLKYKYLIDNKKLIPHLSFFHINISPRKLPILAGLVQANVNGFKPVRIFFKSVVVDNSGIFISLSNHKSLVSFNRKMVKLCSPLRDGSIPWVSKRLPNRLEKFNRRKYGTHWNIGKTFQPHFTMARLKFETEAAVVYKRMRLRKFSFLGNTIAVCQVNKHCQVTRVIKKFKL